MSLTREWIHQHPLMGRYSSSKMKAQLGNFELNLPQKRSYSSKDIRNLFTYGEGSWMASSVACIGQGST